MKNQNTDRARHTWAPWLKAVAYLLSILLFLYAVPTNVFAELIEAIGTATDSNDGQTTIEETESGKEGTVFEVIDRREETVKHFRTEDGSFTAVQYNVPVHEKDENGEWQDIDNTLSESGSEYATSNARVKFAKKTTGNSTLFTLHDGNRKITMSLSGANKKVAGQVINTQTEFPEHATQLQKMMTLDKLSSKILYPEILEGVDLEYVVNSCNIKENIIVKERADSYSYTFEIQLNNLDAVLCEDGSVAISDPDTDEVVYTIPKGYMFDADGEYSEAVEYTLTNGGNGKYSLTVTANAEWINDEGRAFPVTVDPSLSNESITGTDVQIYCNNSDFEVTSNNPTIGIGSFQKLFWQADLPVLPQGIYIVDAYLSYYSDFGSNDCLSAYVVTESRQGVSGRFPEIEDYCLDYCVYPDLSLSACWFTWDITEAVTNWYNGDPNYGICVENNDNIDGATVYSYESSIVAARPQFVITYRDSKGIESYWSYSSQQAGAAGTGAVNYATGELTFQVETLSTTDYLFGYMPYLVYQSSQANEYNINSDNTNTPQKYGSLALGWHLSTDEAITWYPDPSNDEKNIYILTDGDGTEHYFLATDTTGTYRDEDGLGLMLHVLDNGSRFEIIDSAHNTRAYTVYSSTNFAEGALLTSIKDPNGNELLFLRETSYGRITNIQMSPNGISPIIFLEFAYDDFGYLTSITDNAYDRRVSFIYADDPNDEEIGEDGLYLRQVVLSNANGDTQYATASYFYSNEYSNSVTGTVSTGEVYRLSTVYDGLSQRFLEYSYDSMGRVIDVTEFAYDDREDVKQGQSILMEYGNQYTAIHTSGSDEELSTDDDIVTRYCFDSFGRAVSVYSTDLDGETVYGATGGSYDTNDESINSIKTSVVSGGSSANYLLNGSFELSNTITEAVPYWYTNNSQQIWVNNNNVNDCKYVQIDFLSNGSEENYELYQVVFLSNGEYTLSFEYSTIACANVNVSVEIIPYNESEPIASEVYAVNLDYAAERVCETLTFEVTNANSSHVFFVKFLFSSNDNSGASITLDNCMLERNIGCSPYSLVQCGSFDSYHYHNSTSSPTSKYKPEDFWTVRGSSDDILLDGSGRLKINSDINLECKVYQTIYQASTANLSTYQSYGIRYCADGTYIVSGFAEAENAAPSGSFAIVIEVDYYDRTTNKTETVTHEFPFLSSLTSKQFITGSFTLDSSRFVKEIRVLCDFSFQHKPEGTTFLNTAYFDQISVVKATDNSVVEYEYYTATNADSLEIAGKIKTKKTPLYDEYYYYDPYNYQPHVIQNTLSKTLVEYVYDSDYFATSPNQIVCETYDTDFDKIIQKVVTEYTYNDYGQALTERTSAYKYDSSGNPLSSDEPQTFSAVYTYVTTSTSHIFGAPLKTIDSAGYSTTCVYDAATGYLQYEYANDNSGLYYTYDDMGRIIEINPVAYIPSIDLYYRDTISEKAIYSYNSRGQTSTIQTASTIYNFTYDEFGNTKQILIGGRELVSYEYAAHNGKLSKMTYAANSNSVWSVEYVYDALDRISEVWYTETNVSNSNKNRECRYRYTYTSSGSLAKVENCVTGETTLYRYSTDGNLIGCTVTDDHAVTADFIYRYDDKNRLTESEYSFDYLYGNNSAFGVVNCYYDYDADDSLKQYTVYGDDITGAEIYFTYDALGRLVTKRQEYDNFVNSIELKYKKRSSTVTTSLISQYTSKIIFENTSGSDTVLSETAYSYTYDNTGNITSISNGTETIVSYTYDDQNQLIRENNKLLGYTYIYSYDNAGNRTNRRKYAYTTGAVSSQTILSTETYRYDNSNWRDQLTQIVTNDVVTTNFTYDDLGNPTTYSGYTLTWEGRQLTEISMAGGQFRYTFTYNDEGLRTSKTSSGLTHKYVWEGSTIVSEAWGNHFIIYLYDESGSPIGMQYRAKTYDEGVFDTYYFEKNLQGDIIAVYNAAGNKLGSYTYDAWGNFTTSLENTASSAERRIVNTLNPFRYRGYYYDTETGLYYLQSRYYNPQWGRFLNVDSALYDGLLGVNTYLYCSNNPANYVDYFGENGSAIWEAIIALGTGGSVADGLLPFGEIILVIGLIGLMGTAANGEVTLPEVSSSISLFDVALIVDAAYSLATSSSVAESANVVDKKKSDTKGKKGGKNKPNPDPYAREGQKSQGRENKYKARKSDNFKSRNNLRGGGPRPPKHHTPGRGHNKYKKSRIIIIFFGTIRDNEK